jgi:predicted RNA binding protein YcfA (HicA-like mRNA interferase family)
MEARMTNYTREVKRLLKEHGWQFHRQGRGDHEIWIDPATGNKVTVDSNIGKKL